jgi:hypothetical protein
VDSASAFDVRSLDPWAEPDDDSDDDSWDDWQIEDVAVESRAEDDVKPVISVVAAAIKTAAAMSRETGDGADSAASEQLPRISPDVFKQGMTVTHPEYGPGKIVALSGAGKNRRATIQFATVGQKKIILAHSTVRPAR